MKKLVWLLLLLFPMLATAQTTNFAVGTTVIQADPRPGGLNLDSWNPYWSIDGRNLIGAAGNTAAEPFYGRQIFVTTAGPLTGGSVASTTQTQTSLSNTQYDGVPLNFYSGKSATLTVGYTSSGTDIGFSSPISFNTQASSVEGGTLTGITQSAGINTATYTHTSGSFQSVGNVVGMSILGTTGGTGTINRVVTATITSASAIVTATLNTGTATSGCYLTGDIITAKQSGATAGTFTVTATSCNIVSLTPLFGGYNYSVANALSTTSSGTGNGAKVNITATSNQGSFTYTAAGENFTGVGYSGATVGTGQGSFITLANPRTAAFAPGDIWTTQWFDNTQTPQCVASGGATCVTESTDVCTAAQTVDQVVGGQGPGCGQQSFACDTTAGGSCQIRFQLDTTSPQNFLLLNGVYRSAFMAKAASGSPTMSVNVQRTGVGRVMDYSHAASLTSTWTQFTNNDTLSENTNPVAIVSQTPGTYTGSGTVTATGGSCNGGNYPTYSATLLTGGIHLSTLTQGDCIIPPTGFTVSGFSGSGFNVTFGPGNLGNLWVTWSIAGSGVAYIDNMGFYEVGTDSSNTSIFRDKMVAALRARHPGTIRMWAGGLTNGTTVENMLQPIETMLRGGSGFGVYSGGSYMYSIPATLKLAQVVGNGTYVVVPHIVIPIGAYPTEMAHLAEYYCGAAGTTYGDLRIAQGGPSAAGGWTSVFTEGAVFELGNENWNNVADGLGFRSGSSYIYEDLGRWANIAFGAIRGSASWSACLTKPILTVGVQTSLNPIYSTQLTLAAHADAAAIAGYYSDVVHVTTPAQAFYGPAMTEAEENANGPTSSSGFFEQLTQLTGASTGLACGASGTVQCKVVDYEQNFGTGNVGCNQTCLATLVSGRVGAYTAWAQNMFNVNAGIRYQSDFSMQQYSFTENGFNFPGWGEYTDWGGQMATNNAALLGGNAGYRPTAVGGQLADSCVIGQQLGITTTNQILYNLATNTNSVDPTTNAPTLNAFAFQNGGTVCMTVGNADPVNSWPFTVSGTNGAAGAVVQTALSTGSLGDTNEAYNLGLTGNYTALVYPITNNLTGVNSSTTYTLAPGQIMNFVYSPTGSGGTATGNYITSGNSLTSGWHISN